jgi:methyltransferase family protein
LRFSTKTDEALRPSLTIVELGMGDGRLLELLAYNGCQDESGKSITYIGIEIDKEQYESAKSRIKLGNVKLINGSFKDILPSLPDWSIDKIIAVLPDPTFIDPINQHEWMILYRAVFAKLKNDGLFQLVTEITDELLLPVSDAAYHKWGDWLVATFESLGFDLMNRNEDAPIEYSTRCIDLFRADPQRIRMVTLDFRKHYCQS